jgi:hypothetical protein
LLAAPQEGRLGCVFVPINTSHVILMMLFRIRMLT